MTDVHNQKLAISVNLSPNMYQNSLKNSAGSPSMPGLRLFFIFESAFSHSFFEMCPSARGRLCLRQTS